MSCRASNPFGLLDLDQPSPEDFGRGLCRQPNPVKKGASMDATAVASQLQRCSDPHRGLQGVRNQVPRQNGPTAKPGLVEPRDRKNNVNYRNNQPPHVPNLPPRLQQQSRGACLTTPGSFPGSVDPCSEKEHLNTQLKQEVFGMLKKPPPVSCEESRPPCPPQPLCGVPSDHTPRPGPVPNPPNPCTTDRDGAIVSSTPTQRMEYRKGARHPPEVILCKPTDGVAGGPLHTPSPPANARAACGTPCAPDDVSRSSTDASVPEKFTVSLPAPPGLSRPSGRGRGSLRGRGLPRPVNKERRIDQTTEDSNFERYNAPMVEARVISPPLPSGPTPNAVKLPARQDVRHIPPSPTVSASSLSEDVSGSSSVQFSSDTTFTSVDSNVSNKASECRYQRIPRGVCLRWLRDQPCYYTPCRYRHERPICMDWLNGFPCFKIPCKFRHERPEEPANPTTQPTSSPAGPASSSDVAKTPLQRDQKADLTPPRPEPLFATTVADHIKVRFDQGFEVREVVTGFESRWVHLGNIAGTVTRLELDKLLAPYNVDTINLPESSSGKPVTARVQFVSAVDAMKAVTDLNGTELAGTTIKAKLPINNSIRGSTVLVDTDVQLVWQCPSRVGYAGYDTLKEAKAAIDSLHGFPIEDSVVSAQLYEGLPCVGAYNVILKYLPASVNEGKLRKLADAKAVMLGRPNYQSLDKAVKSIRSRLEEYGTIASLDLYPPPYKDGLVKAWARYTSPAEARAAQDDFDRRRPTAIGLTFISCRHVLSLSHTLNATMYKKMRGDIAWLRWSWHQRYGHTVSIREKFKENADDDTPAFIRLSSEQPELLSSLKYEYEQLLHGDTITLDKKPVWDDFLITPAGHAYIAQVQAQYPGLQIEVQKNRRVIALWGPIVMRHRARQDIVRRVMELKAQQFWKIPLSGKLLRIFCSTELSSLQELLGPENCILDFAERVLVVRGNDRAFRTACDVVQEVQSRQGDAVPSSDVICPVCFDEAVVPVSLACGHQWCRACLTGYLTSAVENKMFPLRCLGNDASCTQRIPLGLSRKLLSAVDFKAVIEAAFWVYAHSRPDEFHHCPTPDCTQVYRTGPPNAVLQCPSCLVRICPSCRIEYHDGMTCEERDVAEDKLFQAWTTSHDVKSCPGCKAPIERSEGCNHMTCTRCQTHICWECLATFPRGQGIYEHMRVQHGSIGL